MSFFQKITRPTDLLILINKSSIVLYETNGPIPIAKLTVPLGGNYNALKQFLEDFNNPTVKIVLDQASTTKTKISIPDVGRVQIEKKLKSFIKKESPDISTSLIARKPYSVEKDWEFIITKNTLSQNTKTALSLMLESEADIQGIYLSFSSNITLCQKLSKMIAKEENIPKEQELFIYLQDSNDNIYQFIVENHRVVEIKSKYVKKEELAKYINEKLNFHDKKSTEQKKEIYVLVLLPEQIRTKINTHTNQFFRSPKELYKKFQTNTISTQFTYTALLCHFNFIKYNPKPLPIKQIETHKALHLLNKTADWLFAGTAAALLYCTVTMAISYKDLMKELPTQQKTLAFLRKDYNHSAKENILKEKILNKNKDAIALYHLIRSNKYSTRILDSIEKSNTENLPIKKLTYLSPIESYNKNMIELELDRDKVSSIKTFTQNMKKNLPEQEIISFLRNTMPPTIVIRILNNKPS